MIDNNLKIYMKDVRNASGCSKGTRRFFKCYNLDFQKFLKDGITVGELRALNDALANQIIEVTYGRK